MIRQEQIDACTLYTYTDRVSSNEELLSKVRLLIDNNCLDQMQQITPVHVKYYWDSKLLANTATKLLSEYKR